MLILTLLSNRSRSLPTSKQSYNLFVLVGSPLKQYPKLILFCSHTIIIAYSGRDLNRLYHAERDHNKTVANKKNTDGRVRSYVVKLYQQQCMSICSNVPNSVNTTIPTIHTIVILQLPRLTKQPRIFSPGCLVTIWCRYSLPTSSFMQPYAYQYACVQSFQC